MTYGQVKGTSALYKSGRIGAKRCVGIGAGTGFGSGYGAGLISEKVQDGANKRKMNNAGY